MPRFVFFLSSILIVTLPASAQQISRQEFVDQISQLRVGMHVDQVRELLGAPDDIRTHLDPGGISTRRTKEIWAYGTNGHLTFPTLGQVYIDIDDRVQYIYGGRDPPEFTYRVPRPKPDPPNPELIGEEELRELLRTIDRAPHLMRGPKPSKALDMIQIVNALQPLGKEKALAVIDEYLRVCTEIHRGPRTDIIIVLRILFELPEDPSAIPLSHAPGEREYRPQFPLYPVVIHKDVPFFFPPLGGVSFSSTGGPPPPWSHVEYYREHGVIRARPLRPPENPLVIFDELLASPKWTFKKKHEFVGPSEDEMARWILADQLLALVETVYKVEADEFGRRIPLYEDLKARWNKILGEFSQLDVRWDVGQQKYVFADGSILPKKPPASYRREIWKLDVPDRRVWVIMERVNEKTVNIILEHSAPDTVQPIPSSVFRIFNVDDPSKTLTEVPFDGGFSGGSSIRRYRVELAPGGKIQIEMVTDGQVETVSPVFKP